MNIVHANDFNGVQSFQVLHSRGIQKMDVLFRWNFPDIKSSQYHHRFIIVPFYNKSRFR